MNKKFKPSEILNYPSWNHDNFEPNHLSIPDCGSKLHFVRNYVYGLAEVLNIPDEITTYNRCKFNGFEALRINEKS